MLTKCFLIQRMMRWHIINTSANKESKPLSTLTGKVDVRFTKGISRLTTMEYHSAGKVFPCEEMVWKPPRDEQNSDVLRSVSSEVLQNVHVRILALMLDTGERSIWWQKNNPRLFNDPPRGSRKWKKEYNARTSSERCNKREKIDYKLEDGRHRSTKMWYCRLFAIMMCQHLDAWINQSHIMHKFL